MESKELRNFISTFDQRLIDYGTLAISKKKFYEYLHDGDCFGIYLNSENKINKAEKLRTKQLSERHLEVLYIAGASGSGKTTAAKYLAEKNHYDYFVSGSGDDFLDGYDMEECIILDDLRGNALFFNEFLKLLDNNTNSSIKSRYNNKDISHCKLIIITSVYKPEDLYRNVLTKEGSDDEPVEQYFRRLKHHFIEIQNDGELEEFTLNSSSINYHTSTNRTLGNINDIYAELGINPNKVDEDSIFNTMFTSIRKDRYLDGKFDDTNAVRNYNISDESIVF